MGGFLLTRLDQSSSRVFVNARVDTRLRILEVGGRLVHEKGFNNTGLSEILCAADVPKGSFYYYFKSKEDFGAALIDFYIQQDDLAPTRFLGDVSLAPLERILRFLQETRRLGALSGYSLGCPLGKLVQEMSEVSECMRHKLEIVFQHIVDRVASVLHEAMQKGEVSDRLDVRLLAGTIVSAWQGALMRMKLERSPRPLDELENIFLFFLQK